MREVSIKVFQSNIYAQLKELPCLVTKNDKPYFLVATPEYSAKVATNEVATSKKGKWIDSKIMGKKVFVKEKKGTND